MPKITSNGRSIGSGNVSINLALWFRPFTYSQADFNAIAAGTKQESAVTALKYARVPNLQEIPDLSAEDAERDTIEITVLSDEYHEFADGLKNRGEDSSIDFSFLFNSADYDAFYKFINAAADVRGAAYSSETASDELKAKMSMSFLVVLPDNQGCFEFNSDSASVHFNGVGVNSALTYTLTIKPKGSIEWHNKADFNSKYVGKVLDNADMNANSWTIG